ncbi:hypothetical protein DQP55_12960 [Mycolicibacterium sp. GF69]|uniref:hypothetical protein n=1 Tax=Mycolicibacterium sp. GF69 TaxID=2267251 RepID=UPI000DCC8012|nr:hypothetical protein [Mycolicibacterium sp. GF69]RAV11999.1 hypothetical protein DQP55_12960 [Mycolicibacterium sp. GF69]
MRETSRAIAVAVVVAGLGGAAIYAATDSGTRGAQPPFAHGMAGGPVDQGMPPAALHSEFVTPGGSGGPPRPRLDN